MSVERRTKAPWLPPRWFIRLAWAVHRGVYRAFGGRVGLWRPKAKGWGTLRLTTTGRRTGQRRSVIVGYFEDGPNLVSLAMNGWGEGEPAWWLNLQAHPDADVELADGRRSVRARAATGEERTRLWARWRAIDANLDAFAALRPHETAVVVLAPRPGTPGAADGTDAADAADS
ncbi:nitroreductase/quinone reductase family protein [Kitasatospora sp. NPDC127111]|uniref:nitroreductase/quinone reductase family protein n=1 Tax=Kitasatospora sp. NPDC127111 TaxID=3345363 RepID=UPI00364123B1